MFQCLDRLLIARYRIFPFTQAVLYTADLPLPQVGTFVGLDRIRMERRFPGDSQRFAIGLVIFIQTRQIAPGVGEQSGIPVLPGDVAGFDQIGITAHHPIG